ncbi:MAG: hypothetical protein ABI988_01920, partial [Nitrospirota bacterium]
MGKGADGWNESPEGDGAENMSSLVSAGRLKRDGHSNKRRHNMNVLVATDGSKYGRWALNWVGKLPLA